jgi:DnaJ-class molecular chaperone
MSLSAKQAPPEPCGWCEGKGIVSRIVRGEMPSNVTVHGVTYPCLGTLIDARCGRCGGTGREGGRA